ncbi:AEC family transporter [Paraherbaspirillum soli]|uniref:AEC family transporter n=1 Tax=Paraherbaspirillum soli TaxID=631222 RepID=A0ABW0M792_9BURK
MTTFFYLFSKLLPAYLYVAGGYASRRWLRLSQDLVAKTLFYGCVPIVVFKGALFSEIAPFLLLVALAFGVSSLMAIGASAFTGWFKDTVSKGTLRCAFGYFNIGWFGIPIVQAIYGNSGANVMTALYVGGMLFGNTVGFLLIASEQPGKSSALSKLFKVPAIYMAAGAFLLHWLGLRAPLMNNHALVLALDVATLMTSVLGMGLVGMSVANVAIKTIDWRKLGLLLGVRVLLAAAIVGSLAFTLNWLGYLQPMELKVFLLMPLLPIAANILVFTSSLRTENEFIGVGLLASTVLSCALLFAWLAYSGSPVK